MPSNDPLGAVFPGDQPPNSARGWNALFGAARRTRQNVLGDAPGGEPLTIPADPANLVFIKAGDDGIGAAVVSRYGETPLDLALDEDAARRRPVYAFGAPTNSTDPVAITVEAVGPRANARAVCAGVARCRVNVTSEAHPFAVPIAGDSSKLASHETRGYFMTAREGGTGTQWAQVLLGGAGAAGSATDCRGTLAGLLPTSRLTFRVLEGSGWCAEIEAATLTGWRPDEDVEEWVSLGTFPTKLGDTSLTFKFDADTGEPVLLLTATTGEGSGATTVIQPMTLVGCVGGCLEFAARPLLWCDSRPVTDCDMCPGGAPRRYRLAIAGGTGGYANLNGTHAFEYGEDCSWAVTTPGYSSSFTWLDMGGGDRQLQMQLIHDATGAFVAWNSATVATSADCCASFVMAEAIDFDPGSGGAGDLPALPTVTAVGPCAVERCADNTFRVRVCCKGHTKYTGCDALPVSVPTCIFGTSGYGGGEPAGGTILGNYGPGVWGGGGGGFVGSMFACDTGDAHDYDDALVRCGWNFSDLTNPVVAAAINAVGLNVASLIKLLVYYDPDAEGGAGAWVLARIFEYGETGDCQFAVIATAANDPDPADDPFEIVFRWETSLGSGLYHELKLTPGPCGDEPVCDAPACPDGAAAEYTFTVAGGDGDWAVLNGDWAVTHATGDEWVGVLGTATATLDAAAGVITFDAPGFPALGVCTIFSGSFNCCGDTVFNRPAANMAATGTRPTGFTATPVGDCECPE